MPTIDVLRPGGLDGRIGVAARPEPPQRPWARKGMGPMTRKPRSKAGPFEREIELAFNPRRPHSRRHCAFRLCVVSNRSRARSTSWSVANRPEPFGCTRHSSPAVTRKRTTSTTRAAALASSSENCTATGSRPARQTLLRACRLATAWAATVTQVHDDHHRKSGFISDFEKLSPGQLHVTSRPLFNGRRHAGTNEKDEHDEGH